MNFLVSIANRKRSNLRCHNHPKSFACCTKLGTLIRNIFQITLDSLIYTILSPHSTEYDQNLASSRDGVYTFNEQGQVYHRIHSFSHRESDPKDLELYFYNDDPIMSHQMRLVHDEPFKAKDQNLITKLAKMLRGYPYAEGFRSME